MATSAPPPPPRERISFTLSDVQRRDDQQPYHESDAPLSSAQSVRLQPHGPHAPRPPPHHHPSSRREGMHYPHRDAVEVAAALEYREPARHRASNHHSSHHHSSHHPPHIDDEDHLVSVQRLQPSLPPPSLTSVPALPQRRGPSCVCSLACVALVGCLAFSACMLAELSYVNLELGGGATTALQRRRDYARHMRMQQRKLGTATPRVHLGLWDEHALMTPLQLTVALSLALGVDEKSILVVDKGSHFFDVWVDNEGQWLLDTINAGPEHSFFRVLNAQATVFGAKMVMSNEAALVAINDTAANNPTPPYPLF